MAWGARTVEASGGPGNMAMSGANSCTMTRVCESLFSPMESLVVHKQEAGKRSRLCTFSKDENRDADIAEVCIIHGLSVSLMPVNNPF